MQLDEFSSHSVIHSFYCGTLNCMILVKLGNAKLRAHKFLFTMFLMKPQETSSKPSKKPSIASSQSYSAFETVINKEFYLFR